MDMRENSLMNTLSQHPIRVMRIIARMNVGGPAVQVTGIMRGLNQSEFNHRLYTGYCDLNEADYLDVVARDVEVIRIQGLGRHINLKNDIEVLFTLVSTIRSFKPDIIHTHTAKAGFLGRLASIISMHPSIRVHTYHGHLLNGYFYWFKKALIVIAEKSLALFTDQLLAVGYKVRQDLLESGIGKIEAFGIMPPGLKLSALPGKHESSKNLGLDPDLLQCGFIGRVTQIKRPDRFLDVASEVKRRGINLNFFIAGDGELLDYCRERISKENLPVKLLGWQGNIEKVLASSDIVLLTSDSEGTPLSLIQAGMAGLPTVSTNVGSISEVVIDGVTGLLTSFDVIEIANALEKLTSNRKLRQQFGMAARDFTLANFGVERLVLDHEKLYKKLFSNRAKI
jgi:glycosyltransferase involved in cell wall biosynthesis